MKKKICVITGSRAEYGLLAPLMREIKNSPKFILQVVATGMHLSPEFGFTYKEIIKDGFRIDQKVKIDLTSDDPRGISKSMGKGMIGFGDVYNKLSPDMVVVLGDRFEIFSAVTAAYVAKIPVAHIHGGEVTEGAMDEAFRHCITKMSQLHFTATETYRKRVIQLGESPKRVFNVGAIGLDNIKNIKLLSKISLEKGLDLKFNKNNLLVTYHPVTLENNTSKDQFKNLLAALDQLSDTNIIFTKSNADAYGRVINKMIDLYVSKNHKKAFAFTSLGQLKYLSVLQYVDAVVGNSSSGIIEAPSFKIATVNIGDRQRGRVKAGSIIDCEPSKNSILSALKKANSKEFKKKLNYIKNFYGDGCTAERILKELVRYDFSTSIKKTFYDLSKVV